MKKQNKQRALYLTLILVCFLVGYFVGVEAKRHTFFQTKIICDVCGSELSLITGKYKMRRLTKEELKESGADWGVTNKK